MTLDTLHTLEIWTPIDDQLRRRDGNQGLVETVGKGERGARSLVLLNLIEGTRREQGQ